MSNLAEQLDVDPEKWAHEENDKLLGEVVEVGTYEGEYGACSTYTIRAEHGSTEEGGKPIPEGAEMILYASRTVLRNKLDSIRPRVGDRLGVKYLGIPDGREYHNYRIKHEPGRAPREPQAEQLELDAQAANEDTEEGEDDIPF